MHKAEELSRLLSSGVKLLSAAGIQTPELDAKLLLQDVTGFSSVQIISNSNSMVDADKAGEFYMHLERRLNHEPVHRILGCREFYGRLFQLSPETLIPRPDTELLVDRAIAVNAKEILEIGTGSGAICVSLACELPGANIVATDISQEALDTAKANSETYGVSDRISFLIADIFAGVSGQYDLIVSNPPYIPSADIASLQEEVRQFDPARALDGGEDGYDFYRHIFGHARNFLSENGQVIVEVGIGQAQFVSTLAVEGGFSEVIVIKDLNGIDRVVIAEI